MGNGKKTVKDLKELGAAMGMNTDRKPQGESAGKTPDSRPQSAAAKKNLGPEPEFFQTGADYVSIAEDRIKKLMTDNRYNPFGNLTTSKIRNILTMINDVQNEVVNSKDEVMSMDMVDRIRHIKVRLAYEAGREKQDPGIKKIKEFIERAELITAIDHIGQSRQKFLRYCNYLEALVAYHRFHGGNN